AAGSYRDQGPYRACSRSSKKSSGRWRQTGSYCRGSGSSGRAPSTYLWRRRRSALRRQPYDDLRPELPERSEEHTSELQSRENLVCRLLLEKKKPPLRARLESEV